MCVEICFHEIWSSELGEHFQLRMPDSVRYQRWRHLLALVHVNCFETALESFLGSIRAQKCILYLYGNSLASEGIRSMPCILWETQF
jgi:hypothetical protein